MKTYTYTHKAQYYETDQMGVIHHSNYIRWFEEARVDFLDQAGFSYKKMEDLGIISPVLGIEAEYKSMVHFEDEVVIETGITYFNGIKMTIQYTIRDAHTGELRTTGTSRHCFIDRNDKLISLKKSHPDVYQLLLSCLD